MKVRNEVTLDDIIEGLTCSVFHCPIARAVKRNFPAYEVEVDYEYVRLEKGAKQFTFRLPPEAVAFIDAFDAQQHVEPFSFDLMLPESI